MYGRGACDAKGMLVAQIAAAERLRAAGETRVGLVFVVGEERGSDGAKAANTIAPGSRFLINGEPTDNRLGTATRGVYRVQAARAPAGPRTRACPSSASRRSTSCIDALVALRVDRVAVGSRRWDARSTRSGLISGGVAPNVILAVRPRPR